MRERKIETVKRNKKNACQQTLLLDDITFISLQHVSNRSWEKEESISFSFLFFSFHIFLHILTFINNNLYFLFYLVVLTI